MCMAFVHFGFLLVMAAAAAARPFSFSGKLKETTKEMTRRTSLTRPNFGPCYVVPAIL